jgi:hypothetical protein
MRRLVVLAAAAAAVACDPAPPAEPTEKFTVTGAYVVRPAGTAPAAFYVTIANRSTDGDELVGIASHAFADGAVHRTVDGRMEPVAAAEIPPGGALALAPGGVHGMFTGAQAPLVRGDTLMVALRFTRASQMAVPALVIDAAEVDARLRPR